MQAFGARNYAVLGEVLQRARVICWTICLPIALLWWWMEPVLLALGQEAELSRLAAINMRIMIPGLFLGELESCAKVKRAYELVLCTLFGELWSYPRIDS
jgi:MATE family multidrug resistance protein